jgi:hypothetical protein
MTAARDLALQALQRRSESDLRRLNVAEFVRGFGISIAEGEKLRRSALATKRAA